MKKILWILIPLLIVAAVAGAWFYQQQAAKANIAPPPTAKIERGLLRVIVQTTGVVNSNLDVDIKCKASGEVLVLPYDVNDEVKKDALVLEVDQIDESRAKRQAQAQLDSSNAKLAQAKQNLIIAQQNLVTSRDRSEATFLACKAKLIDAQKKADRTKELLQIKLAAQEDYDTAETTRAQAEADLKTAQAGMDDLKAQELAIDLRQKDINLAQAQVDSDTVSLEDADQRLTECKVTAPMDGVVSARSVQIGTLIQSGTSNVSGGTTVLTLSDLSRMFVYATVDEAQMRLIDDPQRFPGRPRQKAVIWADAYGKDVIFDGEVVRVAAKGVNTSNVVTFEVRIEVTSPNKRLLRPVMTANVEIVNTEKPSALLVPVEAVVKAKPVKRGTATASAPALASASEPASAPATADAATANRAVRPIRATVTIMNADASTETRDVVVGLSDVNNYEVINGLAEGDTVVLNKNFADSRWKPNGPGGPNMRMMGGGR